MCDSAGVYTITCRPTGKQYVGSAGRSMRIRFNRHRSLLSKGIHHCAPLQNAWNKYGADAFTFAPVLICHGDLAVFYEQLTIDALNPRFNVARTAGSRRGVKMPAEWRAQQAERARQQAQENPQKFERLVMKAKTPSARRKQAERMRAQRAAGLGDKAVEACRAKAARYLVHGRMLTVREISEIYDLKEITVFTRIYRGEVGDALAAPARRIGRHK